jgi:hypothetical protein
VEANIKSPLLFHIRQKAVGVNFNQGLQFLKKMKHIIYFTKDQVKYGDLCE